MSEEKNENVAPEKDEPKESGGLPFDAVREPSDASVWDVLAEEADEPEGGEEEQEGGDEEYDDDLVAHAETFGIPREEVKRIGSPRAVREALRLADRLLVRKTSQAVGEPQPQPQPQVEQPAQQTGADDVDLDPSSYDEGLVKAYRALKDKVKALEARLNETAQAAAGLATQRAVQKFDETIASLGDDYVELFGRGETDDLDPKSEQFRNRMRVAMTVRALRSAYQESGAAVPPLPTLVRRAVAAEFSEVMTKRAREEGVRRARNELGQFTSRPNGRTGTSGPLTPDERALAALERKWRQVFGRQ